MFKDSFFIVLLVKSVRPYQFLFYFALLELFLFLIFLSPNNENENISFFALSPWVSLSYYILHNMRPNELQRYRTLSWKLCIHFHWSLLSCNNGRSANLGPSKNLPRDSLGYHIKKSGCHLLCCTTKPPRQRWHKERVRLERPHPLM